MTKPAFPVSKPRRLAKWVICGAFLLTQLPGFSWQAAEGPLKTRWTAQVSPENAHAEYPRPQLVRPEWMNLNGLWDFAIAPMSEPSPVKFQTQILVPFPVESALSGVMKPVGEHDRLWYRRTFALPRKWIGRRVLLHFGAVDFETTVWVNGKELGSHSGGYDGFSFDVTDAMNPAEPNELLVSVTDPTDAGTQPRGKQVRKPNGIWYTPTSGIWQTVWLEPVSGAYISSLKVSTDIDQGAVAVRASTPALLSGYAVQVKVREGLATLTSGAGAPGSDVRLALKNPKLWSPERPHLYDLEVTLTLGGRTVDRVNSYFGMRKISLGKDESGNTRLLLNNQPYFQFGPLDQGFWPDGLYTAPTDQALRYDIETTKKLGFNLARKHVKVEPERWYYWCDKLGLLVWQDMPSGDQYIRPNQPDIDRSASSAMEFEKELTRLVEGRGEHPCIVMWVPFNEGWGQWKTAHVADFVKKLDPSRLVDDTSGWADRGVGDVNDMHKYPGPGAPEPEANRAIVLGEFGGLGLPVSGHTWQEQKNWGYRSFTNSAALTSAYLDLVDKLVPLINEKGLSAAVYTQTTDVEVEVNGLMTYDRQIIKMDWRKLAEANGRALRAKASNHLLAPPAH